jgi:hypothetical protein
MAKSLCRASPSSAPSGTPSTHAKAQSRKDDQRCLMPSVSLPSVAELRFDDGAQYSPAAEQRHCLVRKRTARSKSQVFLLSLMSRPSASYGRDEQGRQIIEAGAKLSRAARRLLGFAKRKPRIGSTSTGRISSGCMSRGGDRYVRRRASRCLAHGAYRGAGCAIYLFACCALNPSVAILDKLKEGGTCSAVLQLRGSKRTRYRLA